MLRFGWCGLLLLMMMVGWCSLQDSTHQGDNSRITNQKHTVIKTDDIRPIDIITQAWVSKQIPTVDFVNAQYTFQTWSCNPANIVTDDAYFKCDLWSQTPSLLSDSRLKDRVFQIYRYNMQMTDNPDQLVMSQTGLQSLDILVGTPYFNQWSQILRSGTKKWSERVLLTTSDIVFAGSYISAGQVIVIYIEDTVIPYHTVSSSGTYNHTQYQTSRPLSSSLPIARIPTQGTLWLQSYQRSYPSDPKFTTLFAPSVDSQVQSFTSWMLVSYSWLSEDTIYHIKGSVEQKTFDYQLRTFAPFAVTVSRNISRHPSRSQPYQQSYDHYDNNYHLCFNQPLDHHSLKKSLDDSIWSGRYTMVMSTQEQEYQTRWWNTWQAHQHYCMMMYYYVDPTRSHDFRLNAIKSIFGESLNVTITIPKHQITTQHRYVSIIGNTVNVVTPDSSSVIDYHYKNITGATLSYQACQWTDHTGFFDQLKTHHTDSQDELMSQMVKCSQTYSSTLVFSWFDRWKQGFWQIDINDLFTWSVPQVFKIGFDGQYKYFVVTSLGLIAKYAPGSIYVRTTDIVSGSILSGVQLEVSYLSGTTDTSSITQAQIVSHTSTTTGYYRFDIPILSSFNQIGFIKARYGDDQTILLFPDQYLGLTLSGGKYSNYFNSFVLDPSQIGAWYGYQSQAWRLYAYTDRVLYKAGDQVFVAGWIRKPHQNTHYTWWLQMTIIGPDETVMMTQYLSGVDIFGWFATSYLMPDTVKMWSYRIDYTSDDTSYTTYFTVQEYKKSNYYIDAMQLLDSTWASYVRLQPLYYRWEKLHQYDATIDYRIQGQNQWIYDRDTDPDMPRYYAKVRWADISSVWSVILTGYSWAMDIPLQWQYWLLSRINMSVMVKDPTTQELVYKTRDQLLYPPYLIWIKGWDYDWVDIQDLWSYKIEGTLMKFQQDHGDVLDNYTKVSDGEIKLMVYYKDFQTQQTQWPDQEWYYADEWYTKIAEYMVDVDDGHWSYALPTPKVGKYFVRALYDTGYETQKTIVVYGGDWPVYGDPSNNFKLSVFAKDKTYRIWEQVQIQIEPYIKGATAIVTIEKDGVILDQSHRVLDGNPLVVTTHADRYPNATVSVVQLVGKQANARISDRRVEPRFMIWYQNIKLDPQALALKYQIKVTDYQDHVLDHYRPWQSVKVHIQAQDSRGNGVKSRLSLWIVDKGLIDLYDQIKNPLQTFYIQSIPWLSIISNLKLLYQSLRVFASDGVKGGGWGQDGSGPLLVSPRTKLWDIAFWTGGVQTDDQGRIVLETKLPDNLTTWIVEVIGVWQAWQMWSDRSYMKVDKDVVLTTNIPQFIWYQDRVIVPISLSIRNPHYLNLSVQWSVTLGSRLYPLDIKQIGSGMYQTSIDMNQRSVSDVVSHSGLIVDMRAGDQEHLTQILPIRHEWAMHQNYASRYTDTLDTGLIIPGWALQWSGVITVSVLPLYLMSNTIRYLIHYPYGCVEQSLSALYPLMLARRLEQAGIKDIAQFSGDQVSIANHTFSLSDRITTTLNHISSAYDPVQWLYAFWPWDKTNYELSVYVYQVLSLIRSMGYKVDTNVLTTLEKNLDNQTNPYLRLYYLLHKSMYGKIEPTQVLQYLKWNTNPVLQILAYTTLAYQNINQSDLIPDIESFLKSTQTVELGWRYTPFVDKDIIRSIYVRGLIRNNMSDQIWPHIIDLYRSVDTQGLRWWSTQKNIQMIAMMTEYLLFKSTHKSTPVDVKLTIDGMQYDTTLSGQHTSQSFNIPLSGTSKNQITVQASDNIMIDYDVNYVPQDATLLQDQWHGVTTLDMHYSGKQDTDVGSIVQASARFAVSQNAHQVAVVYPIPSSYKIINPRLLWASSSSLVSFDETVVDSDARQITFSNIGTTRDRYSCQPTYYQIKFDQLFLYYDQLAQGAGCQIQFDMIRTHTGDSTQAPLKLREMYLSNVWAVHTLSK